MVLEKREELLELWEGWKPQLPERPKERQLGGSRRLLFIGGTLEEEALSKMETPREVSTGGNTRNGTASNAFVYTNTILCFRGGHPKTLRASLIVSCFPTELEKNSIT